MEEIQFKATGYHKRNFQLLQFGNESSYDHPVAGEIEEEDDEEPQLGEPGGVAVEPAGGAEEEEIMAAVDAEEHEVEGEEQLELNLSDGSEDMRKLILNNMEWKVKRDWS